MCKQLPLVKTESPVPGEQACADWLAGRQGLRKSAKAAYRNGLQPLRDRRGEMPIQALEKRHLDELVTDLMAGVVVPVHVKEGRGVRGRCRRPWKATTINPMLNYLESMLNELLKQAKVNYNVAALVDRLPVSKVPMQTFTTVEVEKLLTPSPRTGSDTCGISRWSVCGAVSCAGCAGPTSTSRRRRSALRSPASSSISFFLAGPGIESGSRAGFFVPHRAEVPISAARRDGKESS
jgi:hypothetical protein